MKKINIIIFTLLISTIAFSQSISVSSFKLLETDLTANTAGTMEQDQNGETAALIKVVTTQTGFTFDGGALGIVKTKQTPGEVWVYIPKGSKKISIKHPQLGVLRDYYFPIAIEAARTYEMILVAGEVQTIVKQARTSQYVVFQLVPPDAVVELDGELLKTEGGIASKMMKFGTYNYRVQAPNYLLEAGSVTIDDPENKKVVNISLKPNFAQININVDNDAEIWVNGEKKGEGTWSGNLGAGTYELEAKKAGHRNTLISKDIEVTQEPQNITLQAPTPIYGEVDINSSPGMSDIFIDGNKVGQTPQFISKILIGEHTVRFEKDGYYSETKEIIVEEGKICELSIQMNKRTEFNNAIQVNGAKSNSSPSTISFNNEGLSANELAKKYKKNPEALISIGREYFENGNNLEARNFANLADEATKHKSAAAFILLGDIEAQANEIGKAAGYYNQATYCDPKDPIGFYKYALVYRKISPKGAVQKLADLKAQRPDIEVDALSGHIYYLSNEFEKAREAYGKVPVGKMEKNDIVEYAMASYFLGKHAEGLEKVKAGLTKEPRNAAMNRLAMFFNTELGNFDDAVKYGDALFNQSDSAKFSYLDYAYLGNAFNGLKQADKAIEQYNLALQFEFDSKARRASIVKQLSDAYAEKEDYVNAIERYKEYLEGIEKATATDIAALGSLYTQHASKLSDPAAKREAFTQADGVYAGLAEKFENAIEYANFMRARVNAQMDPDSKQGLAKPYYDKLIELIAPKAEKDNTDKARLIEAYRYNIAYFFIVKDDKAQAKKIANKLIAIDPDNAIAKQIIDMK